MKDQTSKYDYIIESYVNGQFTQVKELFFKLRGIDNKLDFVTYLKHSYLSESEKIDFLAFLLRKQIDR